MLFQIDEYSDVFAFLARALKLEMQHWTEKVAATFMSSQLVLHPLNSLPPTEYLLSNWNSFGRFVSLYQVFLMIKKEKE